MVMRLKGKIRELASGWEENLILVKIYHIRLKVASISLKLFLMKIE